MHLHSWLGLSFVILVSRAGKFPWWFSKWDSNPSAILQFHFQPPLQCQVKPITSPCFWHPQTSNFSPKSVEDPPEPPVLDDEEVDGWWYVHVWGRFVKVLREKKVPKKVVHHKLYLAIRCAFFGMVKTWPLQRLLVSSKYGMKRSPGTCNSVAQKTGTWTSTTWTYFEVDLCLAMLNLGDALVTLAAFFSLLWLFWQRGSNSSGNEKMMERQVGRHNFRRLCHMWAGKLRLRIALAFTLWSNVQGQGFEPKWARFCMACVFSRTQDTHSSSHAPQTLIAAIMHMNSSFHFISKLRLGRFWVSIQESDACGVLPISHLCSSWRGRGQQGHFKGSFWVVWVVWVGVFF